MSEASFGWKMYAEGVVAGVGLASIVWFYFYRGMQLRFRRSITAATNHAEVKTGQSDDERRLAKPESEERES